MNLPQSAGDLWAQFDSVSMVTHDISTLSQWVSEAVYSIDERVRKPVIGLVQAYVKYSEGDLLDYGDLLTHARAFDTGDYHTLRENVGAFREQLVCALVAKLRRDETRIDILGSKKLGSDMDITIQGKYVARTAKTLAYCFGLVTTVILVGPVLVRDVFRRYTDIFRPLFDVVVYSSCGVITAPGHHENYCTTCVRRIDGTDHFTLNRLPDCEQQDGIKLMVSRLLLVDIHKWLGQEPKICPAIGEMFHVRGCDFESFKCPFISEDIEKYMMADGHTKFMAQIVMSQVSETYMLQLMSHTREDHDPHIHCHVAYMWELCEVIANMLSPDSSWSIDTFQAIVLRCQAKMDVGLPSHRYFVVCLEMLRSLIYHLIRSNDMRRATKYAIRLQNSLNMLAGYEVVNNVFRVAQEDSLRKISGGTDHPKIRRRLIKLICFASENLHRFAPPFFTDRPSFRASSSSVDYES